MCLPPLIVLIPLTNDKYSKEPDLEIDATTSHLCPQAS